MFHKLKKKIRNKLVGWLMKDVGSSDVSLSDFEKVQYELRPGDVLLFEGHSRVSEVIKLVTQSHWSHAALYVGRLHDIDDPKSRKLVTEHYYGPQDSQLLIESYLGKGTVVSPLESYRNEHIRICRPQGISRKDAQQVLNYAIGKLGAKYHVRQILDLARLMLPWRIMPRRWRSSLFSLNPGQATEEICTSVIADAFHSVDFPILPTVKEEGAAGIRLVQKNPKLFTPGDFDYSPFFEIIKYPIFNFTDLAAYRDLPWRRGEVTDDRGQIINNGNNPKEK